jgi:hypothetical protein
MKLFINVMQVSRFNLRFTYKGSKLTATCQKMKVYKHPHLRVAVNKEKGKTDIYIFHEINEPKQKYFWFQLSGIKEEIATIIAKKLEGKMAYSN